MYTFHIYNSHIYCFKFPSCTHLKIKSYNTHVHIQYVALITWVFYWLGLNFEAQNNFAISWNDTTPSYINYYLMYSLSVCFK